MLKKISCNKYFLRNYHPTPKLELEQLLSEYRFKDVALKKTEINLSMPTLDIYIYIYLRLIASSLHVESFTETLTKLRELCNNNSEDYDNKGQVVYKYHDYLFGSCRKW